MPIIRAAFIRIRRSLSRIGWLLAAGLVLTACTAPAPKPAAPTARVDTQAIEQLVQAGDYQGAAERYRSAAAQSASPDRERLLLKAVELWIRAQDLDTAEQHLASLPDSGDPLYTSRRALARAQIQLGRNQAEAALQTLATLNDRVAPETLADYHRTRALAYNQAGNLLESARERVWLDGLLDPEQRPDNHQAIWQTLSQLPDHVLQGLRTAPPPDTLSGWMELVQILRGARDDPQQQQQALALWRTRYPGHPADPAFIDSLLGRLQAFGAQPGQIALLLPLSGQYQEAGQALRDGIMAAYLQTEGRERINLRVYDTGVGSQQVWGLYQQAIREGAQMVIGPLIKEAVTELARAGSLEIPVLALNAIEEPGPFPLNLYQYSLAPEDEARQVADRAWQDGHRNALAIVPEGIWGERVLDAFTQHWQSLGGQLLEVQRYGEDQRNYSNQVRELLNIDSSEQRHQSLSRLIGRQPEFEPRRRQDADFVMLVAYPQQARLLRPLLRFHRASRLPVYSTSQIYTGTVDSRLDRDLDGVRFCDMPWLLHSEHPAAALRSEIARLWPEREQRFSRLFAMGVDAFQLTRYLLGLGDGTFARHPGVTGDLYLDAERRVHRDLQWARFNQGQPIPLAPTLFPDAAAGGGPEAAQSQEIMDDDPGMDERPPAGDTR